MLRIPAALAAAVITLVVVIATWPQAIRLSSGVTDFGDPLLNAWTLAWVPHAVVTHPTQLFDANIFYPEHGTLAYSESLLVPALITAPIVWLGGDPMLVQNLWVLLGYALSGLATFLLVRALTQHDGAALVAGVIFAIYPYRADAYPKVQLQLTFWLPMALLVVHRLTTSPSWRKGVAIGLLLAAQLYSCLYYGMYGSVLVAIIAVGAIVVAPRAARGAIFRALAVAIVVTAALSAPLLAPYRAASRVVGERSMDDVARGSAEPRDYLAANPDNAFHGDARHPGVGERRLFPGYLAPALAVAGVIPPTSGIAVAYLIGGGAMFDLSLGVNGPGYGWLYDVVRPFRALRVPARFGMLFGLALAVLAGFGVARICRLAPNAAQLAIVLVAVVAVTIESRSRPLDLSTLPDQHPAVYTWLAAQPRGVVCEFPVGNLQGRAGPQDATYMYYSTRHWQPLVNGYSGFSPPSYGELLDRLRTFPSDDAIAYLRSRGVTYLLVHSAFYIRGDFAADVRALKARTDLQWLATFPWKGGHASEAFRITP